MTFIGNTKLLGSEHAFTTTVTFFRDGELDTLALWKRNQGLVFAANDKHVTDTGSECAVKGILDVNDFKAALVLFTVGNGSDTAHVVSSSDIGNVSRMKLDKVNNLSGLDINLDSVVDLDEWIRVADGAPVVSNGVWDSLLPDFDVLDLAELELCFFVSDAVDSEATLDVVDETEVFASLFNGDDIFC